MPALCAASEAFKIEFSRYGVALLVIPLNREYGGADSLSSVPDV